VLVLWGDVGEVYVGECVYFYFVVFVVYLLY